VALTTFFKTTLAYTLMRNWRTTAHQCDL